jgi:hypothetical protein
MLDRTKLSCVTFAPMSAASLELRAALYFIAPTAVGWRYLDSATRTGAIVALPDGSKREVSARELNHAYALMADAEPGTLPALAIERARIEAES